MKYTPKTPAEIAAESKFNPLTPGIYFASIESAIDTLSKAQNPMVKIELTVEGQRVYDYIGDWNHGKLAKLMEAAGLDYKLGDVEPHDLVGKMVRVKTFVEKGKDQYEGQDKTGIRTYLPADDSIPRPAPVLPSVAQDGPTGDKIPF